MWSVSSTIPADSHVEVADAKSLLRDAIRAHRRTRSERACTRAAEAIAEQAEPMLEDVACAAVYASRRHEPGTGPLLGAMHARGVRTLLPMLGAGLARDWAHYSPGDTLEFRAPGRPPEPDGPALGEEAIAEASLIIVPALSVDDNGYRLGQGGGWYDRVLRFADDDATILAICFDDELSSKPLPRADHDRRVHGAITPSAVRMLA